MVPIIRNLYQSRRQILWGFMNSLISKDVLIQYNWIGQGNSEKKSFEKLKHIQSIMWCAMIKISSSYSVKEFEADLKANLTKCAARMKNESHKERENKQQEDNDES